MTTFKDFKYILLEDKLTPEINSYLFSKVFTRKPTNFLDLGNAQSVSKMPKDVQTFIKGLKMILWKDLYGEKPVKDWEFWRPHGGTFKLKNNPGIFKVKTGSTIILIDTSGYDYPRYAARIKK